MYKNENNTPTNPHCCLQVPAYGELIIKSSLLSPSMSPLFKDHPRLQYWYLI
jgi:hypothetical protein